MQGTTGAGIHQLAFLVLHGLVVMSILGLALVGQMPAEAGGWVMGAAMYVESRGEVANRHRGGLYWAERLRGVRGYLAQSWRPVMMRSLLLWALWAWSGWWGPGWLLLLPWVLWLWRGLAVGWPSLWGSALWRGVEQGLWQGQRLAMVGYLGLGLQRLPQQRGLVDWPLAAGCVVCGQEEPSVRVERDPDGSYQVTLCGHFTMTMTGRHPFWMRLLIYFLSQLEIPASSRGSRRTRDGRTPLVRQEQMAAWFDVPQSSISRWMGYFQAEDWANLLSLHSPEVLTAELMERIVTVFATFPTWSVRQVHQHLCQQGMKVTEVQVAQAAEQSGWLRLRQTLIERYELGETTLRLRDEWVVGQLAGQVQTLLAQLEEGQGLPPEERLAMSDLMALATPAPPPFKALPWLLRLEQLVLHQWHTDHQVRCPDCGSSQVGRKSATPRTKTYYDPQGQLQEVAVYRYYCRNPQCPRGSFTNLPPGLLPYSRYRAETHLLAVQMYSWGYSTYRRTGTALGVASLTAWRWVQAWGHGLLPVAALFGLLRSSGVVGVDEKYVLVPKNDKPDGVMRRWMYVYFAVDVWTYDLLHIAIYPHNDQASALAFLLALRTKGYHPDVLITDLRQDYGPIIPQVFPNAIHHLCIFHALQNAQKHIKDVYGSDYAQEHPHALVLKDLIYAIFDTDSPTVAAQRYADVLALRPQYLEAQNQAQLIFDFLERHWPLLANSIGNPTIPATNNTVELVIRRFDQHYKTFCGFESIHHAQAYLAVFEKVYRFTPFSQDAQPRIRGRCPLQLAGYDVSQLPMATLCAGLSLIWPLQTTDISHVPSS